MEILPAQTPNLLQEIAQIPQSELEVLPPNETPVQYVEISPEALELANHYLQTQNIDEVCNTMGVTQSYALNILNRREVKAYIDHVFMDCGFNNRILMRRAMDAILRRKFQDMEEMDVGSEKDILDIMKVSHQMTMDILDRQIKLEQIRMEKREKEKVKPTSQVNLQINDNSNNKQEMSMYEQLLSKLIQPPNA
jgi:CHAT domain-containing protein